MLGLKKSPWVIHYDASSCNGCDIEVLACLTPVFDVERLGIVNTGNPKHADIFLVTGAVNEQSKSVIRNIYNQMPEPKVVVAIGACASTGGIFRDCYNICGGVDTVIPVDVYVPGCAARPEVIIGGVAQSIDALARKATWLRDTGASRDKMIVMPAVEDDAGELLALQKICAGHAGELFGTENVPDLMQTLPALRTEVAAGTCIKAAINAKIVGQARGIRAGGTARLTHLMVHPFFRGKGTGVELLETFETEMKDIPAIEAAAYERDQRTMHFLTARGYQQIRTEDETGGAKRIILRKERA
jgi:ech hydrogenase subunit C